MNEVQYRLQAWNLSELNEVDLPDFTQGMHQSLDAYKIKIETLFYFVF